MNDVNNRIFREFTEFFDNVEKSASEISVTMAYEITMKSTISHRHYCFGIRRADWRSATGTISGCKIIFWIFFMTCGLALAIHWLADFSTIMKDLVEYDFIHCRINYERKDATVHEKT